MSAARGIGDRLLALEAAVAELRAELQAVGQGVGCPTPTPDREAAADEALPAMDGCRERALKVKRERVM